MGHWFDDLTRQIARAPHSRRSMLGLTARLGLAAAGAAVFGRSAEAVAAAPIAPATGADHPSTAFALAAAPLAANCTVDDSYGILQSVAVTSVTGQTPLTLTHRLTAEVASGVTTSSLNITPGALAGATPRVPPTLRLSTTNGASRTASAELALGADYTGSTPRRSAFYTDGQTVQGAADGKATSPAPLGGDARTTRYTDGRPAIEGEAATPASSPVPSASPDGADAGRGIRPIPGGSSNANEQRTRPPQAGVPAAVLPLHQAIARLIQQSSGDLATCVSSGGSSVMTRCTDCQLSCRTSWLQCSLAAIQASLTSGVLAPSAYLSIASGTCDPGLQQCYRTCKSSGACCPDHCRGDANCCQTAWGCCPPGAAASSGRWSKAWPTCPRCGSPPWTPSRAAQHQTPARTR